MSIDREVPTGNTQAQQRGQASGQQQQADFGYSAPKRDRGNWSSIGQSITPRVPRGPAGAVLGAFDEAIKPVLKNGDTGFAYQTVKMDVADFPQLNVSVLAVVGTVPGQEAAGVGYHILIMEGSIDPIAPIQRQEAGQTYQVQRVVGDAYNRVMQQTVHQHLSRLFSTNRLFSGRASVVPADLKLDDEVRVRELATTAMQASAMAVETNQPGFHDINIAEVDTSSQVLISSVTMPDHHIENAAGRPVRSDFVMNLVAQNRQQGMQQDDSFGFASEDVITSATGYVDLAWYPQVQQQMTYGQVQQANYLYVPNLVITSLHSRKLLTPGMVLLALANTFVLRNQNAWTMAFNPRTQSHAAANLRDIGAIGIDANLEGNATRFGSRFPTSSDVFRQEDFNLLMQTYVRPYMSTSIDIPECDTSTWWMYEFGLAGAGDQAAKRRILEAANQLTNGNFAKRYSERNGSGEVIRSLANRIHQGYYTDAEGNRRDVADFDYLAILNTFGDTDPMVAREWSDSFLDINGKSQDLRLAIRKRILDRVKNVHYTGFAVRNMFEHNFIEALTQACIDCGLMPQLRLPHAEVGLQTRAVANFYDFGMVAPTHGMQYGQMAGVGSQGGFTNMNGFSRFAGQ